MCAILLVLTVLSLVLTVLCLPCSLVLTVLSLVLTVLCVPCSLVLAVFSLVLTVFCVQGALEGAAREELWSVQKEMLAAMESAEEPQDPAP